MNPDTQKPQTPEKKDNVIPSETVEEAEIEEKESEEEKSNVGDVAELEKQLASGEVGNPDITKRVESLRQAAQREVTEQKAQSIQETDKQVLERIQVEQNINRVAEEYAKAILAGKAKVGRELTQEESENMRKEAERKVLIEIKKEVQVEKIDQEKKNIVDRVGAYPWKDLPPAEREKKQKVLEDVLRQWATADDPTGIEAFYTEFVSAKRLAQRKGDASILDKWITNAREKFGAAFSPEEVDALLTELFRRQTLESFAVILVHRQLLRVLEIDEVEGTNHFEEALRHFNTGRTPEEKLALLEEFLTELGEKKRDSKLKELTNLAKDATDTAVKQGTAEALRKEAAARSGIPEASIQALPLLLTVQLAILGPEQQETTKALVESSEWDGLKGEIFKGPLEVQADGSLKGEIAGAQVIVTMKEGRPRAYLIAERGEPVEMTELNARGFNKALTMKITIDTGTHTLRGENKVREDFLAKALGPELPDASSFLSKDQAQWVKEVMDAIFRDFATPDEEMEQLKALHIFKEGEFQPQQVERFVKFIRENSERGEERLKEKITARDLAKAAKIWEKEPEKSLTLDDVNG